MAKSKINQKENLSELKKQLNNSEKSILFLKSVNNSLREEIYHQKQAFQMVKQNFEREKNRLDNTINVLLNVTKK